METDKATEIPIDFELVNRTYRISVKYDWLNTPWRDRLSKFLLANGANKVKRTGSGTNQYLFVSWLDNNHTDNEIKSLLQAAVCMFIEGRSS